MNSSYEDQPQASTLASDGWARARRSADRRLVCQLTTLHPERALSTALVQHLAQEMPDMEFTLHAPTPDVLWVCGFEPGAENLVSDLRVVHPDAFLVVTGKGPIKRWEKGVHDAGADYICSWPLPVEELRRILHPHPVD